MFGDQLVQAFLKAADSWICDSYAMDVRFIAYRLSADWELVEASLAFGPLPHVRDNSFRVETSNLLAGQHQIFPVTKLDAVDTLREASSGRLKVRDTALALAGLEGLDYYSEMTHRDRWFCPLHLKVSARRGAAPPAGLIATLDADLRCFDRPFDGTTDLAAWLGLNADFHGSRAPSLNITVAPPVDLVIDQTSLHANSLVATLHAHPALDTTRITLGIRAAPGDGLSGRIQVGNQTVWSDARDDRRVGKVAVVLPNADSALTLLSIGTETIRRQWIIDPQKARNPRYVSISQFDSDLRRVRHALFEAADGRKFEQGVATVLHILGFAATLPLESDSPDLVVATPGGQTVVVECTTRLADFAVKSGKLVERRSALAKSLGEMNLPNLVAAVLVCRLRRDEIGVTDKELRDRRILLLTSEDIESALIRSRFVLDPDALLQQAVAALSLSI